MPVLWKLIWLRLAEVEAYPVDDEHQGETWQYMGSKINTEANQMSHTFRHRCHPSSSTQEYHHISSPIVDAR